ncbi:TMEM175 family protein [Methylomonas sp. MgM2]
MLKNLFLNRTTGAFSLDRCKALVDGVFAIVATLLVLGIDVPTDHHFNEQGLIGFLRRIGFDLVLYGISFWLAGTYWLQHTAIMRYFQEGSRMLTWLNMLFLFPITLIPFVTELKGTYPHEPLITLLFGSEQIVIGLTLISIWKYAVMHPKLLNWEISESLDKMVTKRMIVSPILVSLLAIALSYVNMHLSTLFFLSVPLYYLSHPVIDQRWSDSDSSGE